MIGNGKIVICGNFSKARRYNTKDGRPHKWFERDYKAIRAYPFQWRTKLGKIECDCKEVIEAYQPYYGFNVYHEDNCAIMKHFRAYPQMQNLGVNPQPFARSE